MIQIIYKSWVCNKFLIFDLFMILVFNLKKYKYGSNFLFVKNRILCRALPKVDCLKYLAFLQIRLK